MEEKPSFVDHTKQNMESGRKSSKRITPRDLAAMATPGGTMKTPTNALRQTKVQKFNAGLKKELISNVKAEKEAEARELAV